MAIFAIKKSRKKALLKRAQRLQARKEKWAMKLIFTRVQGDES